MNTLVAIISKFTKDTETEYEVQLSDCGVHSVKARHTNESILKALVELKRVQENQNIGKIIALVTNEVMETSDSRFQNQTAFEYYSSLAAKLIPGVKIEKILVENEDKSEKNASEVLNELCSYIKKDDIVYIDGAGGKRTTSNVIQLLVKLLKYKGIKNPLNLYASYNPAYISDTNDFLQLTDLTDAFNEFMTAGKSDQLMSFFKEKEINEEYKKLLKIMKEFSDRIRLGNIISLEETIRNLDVQLKICEHLDDDSENIGIVILRQFIPVIREKLISKNKSGDDYLIKIIEWCLDNMLIQQALTIFNEKIPKYLIDRKMINPNLEMVQECKSKNQQWDWQYTVFWEKMLNFDAQLNPEIEELKKGLQNKDYDHSNKKVENILSLIKAIPIPYPYDYKLPREIESLKDICETSKVRTNEKLCNLIVTNKGLLFRLLGIPYDDKKTNGVLAANFNAKFDGIRLLENGNYVDGIAISIKKNLITEIYAGYAYVKYLRNQSNHATESDVINEENKKYLLDKGFDCDDLSLDTIKNNISKILKTIRNEEKKNSEDDILGQYFSTEEPEEYFTDLKKGDRVSATCVYRKVVKIEGYDYPIQLVIPALENPNDYLQKKLTVEIMQISKRGKICQVSYISGI